MKLFAAIIMHTLILGSTLSGKSFLSKLICEGYTKQGVETVVINPLKETGWDCTVEFQHEAEAREYAQQARPMVVFIDEAGSALEKDSGNDFWTASTRHFGNKVYCICNRLQMLSKTLRHNSTRAYIFNCTIDDSRDIANVYREPQMLTVGKLAKGEFYLVSGFEPMRHGQIDFARRKVRWI